MPLQVEHERKYLPPAGEVPALCEGEPYVDITQAYISAPHELPELRVRQETFPSGKTLYSATLKLGELPDRPELPVPINADAFAYWQERSFGWLQKRRYYLPLAASRLVIDQFMDSDLWLAELEAGSQSDEANLASTWQDVTHLPAYRSRHLAQSREVPPVIEPTDQQAIIDELVARQRRSSRPLVIGIAGATASGKTTLARRLQAATDGLLISTDDYYRGQTFMRQAFGYELQDINWDHPESFNLRLVGQQVGQLAAGQTIEKSLYSMVTCDPLPETERLTAQPGRPIIVEGLYTLYPGIAETLDAAIYVDAPVGTRIARRIERDSSARETSWPIESNFRYCMEVAEPTFDTHGTPQKSSANLVINT